MSDHERVVAAGQRALSGDDLLAVSVPLPELLLLYYRAETRHAQVLDAKFTAFFVGVLMVFPLVPALAFLKIFSVSGRITLLIGVAIMLGAGLFTFWKKSRDRSQVYEVTKWLDFRDRTWRSRKQYAHASIAPEDVCISLDAFALVCYTEIDIDTNEASYGVALCHLVDLEKGYRDDLGATRDVFVATLAPETHEFGIKLGRLWGLDCCDASLGMKKISPKGHHQGQASAGPQRSGRRKHRCQAIEDTATQQHGGDEA
jgi:hypothetical protein